jgi:hypothetical protein
MNFIFENKRYSGETAVEIVRAIERDARDYPTRGAGVPDFLSWSMARLADAIPLRELEVSPHLSDETVAFNYLCLLDNYGIGILQNVRERFTEKNRVSSGKAR